MVYLKPAIIFSYKEFLNVHTENKNRQIILSAKQTMARLRTIKVFHCQINNTLSTLSQVLLF